MLRTTNVFGNSSARNDDPARQEAAISLAVVSYMNGCASDQLKAESVAIAQNQGVTTFDYLRARLLLQSALA